MLISTYAQADLCVFSSHNFRVFSRFSKDAACIILDIQHYFYNTNEIRTNIIVMYTMAETALLVNHLFLVS